MSKPSSSSSAERGPAGDANGADRGDVASGPYLFCDYWASVLGLRSVVNPAVLGAGLVSLEHFRRAIDRPRTRLPKLRYYILAFILVPALFPYKVVYDIMRLFGGKARKEEHPVDLMMGRYRLELEPEADGRVRVCADGSTLAEGLMAPDRLGVEVSLFYPTYKLLIAGVVSLVLSIGLLPQLWRIEALAPLAPYVDWLLYGLMLVLLLAVFRDLVTAVLAPLPVFAVRYLVRAPESTVELLLASCGFILLYFVVEWFFLPRPLPPSLFLYVNDSSSELFPYERRHAPYWLEGSHYWVWRFVALAPAELSKFWEKDWERIEVWVRADAEGAGQLEWVVYDCHYRELWFRYDRLVDERERRAHADTVRGQLDQGRAATWVLEADMDLVFHAPYLRGIFVAGGAGAGRRQSLSRRLRALGAGPRADRFDRYEQRLTDLEIDGTEFLSDVPEHFRGLAMRAIVRMPWDYWRYPLGAQAAPRRFVYQDPDQDPSAPPAAADPAFQVKNPTPVPGAS